MIRVFSNESDTWVAALREALRAIELLMDTDLAELHVRVAPGEPPEADESWAVWMSGPGVGDLAGLTAWLATGRPVLPVIASSEAAVRLPEALSAVNAFTLDRHGDGWPAALADEIITLTHGMRRERRVFVSYRRSDGSGVANQIWGYLNRLGFDVFLDDASIERGVNFQRALNAWMADADAVLLLASPEFDTSRWCMHEAAYATNHGIGVVVARWPGLTDSDIDRVLLGPVTQSLRTSDFDNTGGELILTGAALRIRDIIT